MQEILENNVERFSKKKTEEKNETLVLWIWKKNYLMSISYFLLGKENTKSEKIVNLDWRYKDALKKLIL